MEQQSGFLDRIFHLKENHTSVRTEIMAGITTFMTMAYILAVNPGIMSAAGMDKGALLTATALAAVCLEGVIFIILSLTNVREAIFNAIPINLKRAVSAGIGLFIAFIGLVSANIIVANPATKVSLFSFKGAIAAGTFHTVGVPVLLAILGVLFTGILMVKKVRGNILWGILFTWGLGILCELTGLYIPDPA